MTSNQIKTIAAIKQLHGDAVFGDNALIAYHAATCRALVRRGVLVRVGWEMGKGTLYKVKR